MFAESATNLIDASRAHHSHFTNQVSTVALDLKEAEQGYAKPRSAAQISTVPGQTLKAESTNSAGVVPSSRPLRQTSDRPAGSEISGHSMLPLFGASMASDGPSAQAFSAPVTADSTTGPSAQKSPGREGPTSALGAAPAETSLATPRTSLQSRQADSSLQPQTNQELEIAVEVPGGESVPLVLVPLSPDDGFTPQDLAIIEAEAQQFLVQASEAGAVFRPDPARWKSSQLLSDEQFRTWYGQEAFMAMEARRHFDAP